MYIGGTPRIYRGMGITRAVSMLGSIYNILITLSYL